MNAEWRAFLERAGAVLATDHVSHFGRAEAELRVAVAGDVCCDLSHLGLIAVRGPDSEAFLQGQLTCDVRQATLERSLIGAYCSSKGRALASFRLFRRGDDYHLEMPRSMVEPTLARLRKYVLRAKTRLEDASDALVRIGLAGPEAARLLATQTSDSAIEMAVGDVLHSNDITAIRLPGAIPRYELHGPVPEIRAAWEALTPNIAPVGVEAWRLLDILAGMPAVYPETVEAFVPQMLNLELLDGISFKKGCYTGQEIVARTHYLGKLKRRMYLARVESPAPPRPGDPLFSPQADASQGAGRLADACRHPDGGYAVLAVALIECAEQDSLRLGDTSGPELRLEPLPYGFETAV
jgi:hypothetical protein